MITWSVKPVWKKSIIERNYFTKGSDTVMIEIGWRWGEFYVFTDDENPPEIEAGVDIYNCDYDTQLIETSDGCWEEIDYDDCSDQMREWLEEFFDEGNSWLDLEEQGWVQDDCEMIIDCDLEIIRINDDGSENQPIPTSSDETQTSVEIKPGAPWPFSNVTIKEEKQ